MGSVTGFVQQVWTALQRNTEAYSPGPVGARRPVEAAALEHEEVALLSEIAQGVTTDVAAERLGLTSRALRQRLRTICDKLGAETPIEAVVWAAEHHMLESSVEEKEPQLSDEETHLLAEIATGVTTDVAARRLELSARDLRRRLRALCDKLGANTPIEAVVWATRRGLI